jgi:transcriptional regulator with XRE-family HTH domain
MIGPTLRTLRRQRGLSQRALAARAGVEQHHLSTIENDRTNPTIATVARIADAIGYDLTFTPRTHEN